MQIGRQQLQHPPRRPSSTLARSHTSTATAHRDLPLRSHATGRLRQPARLPVPQAHAEALAPPSARPSGGFGHDFSQIRVYPPARGMLQAKLTVSTPGDAYEQEADRIADAVIRMPDARTPPAETSAEKALGAGVLVPQHAAGGGGAAHGAARQLAWTRQAPLVLPVIPAAPMIQRRTLGIAGSCWFKNCQTQLQNFFMIPEDGPPGYHPTDAGAEFRVDDIDGLWFKFHRPTDEWFKIPDIGTAHVICTEDEEAARIQPAAILPFATAGWTNESIHTLNPYA
ncbi:MAG TPA: hypothetical protein VFZ66_18490 [Herpetosiphonaceae bacterium]